MIVEVTEVVTDYRDSKDNKFLELAVSGGAKCIISGDRFSQLEAISLHSGGTAMSRGIKGQNLIPSC
jgi:predicted nucleic acid-binding protein